MGLKTTFEKGTFESKMKMKKREVDILTVLPVMYVRIVSHVLQYPAARGDRNTC